MRRVVIVGILLCLGAALGATVLRSPVAAAQNAIQNVIVKNTATNPVVVREQNVNDRGNIKVHEQGTASVSVSGTVTTESALPAHPFYFNKKSDSDGCGQNLPAGTKWFLTALGGANTFPAIWGLGTAKIVGETIQPVLVGSGSTVPGPLINIAPVSTNEFTFPQPYVLTSPAAGYCLRLEIDNAIPVVVGYRQ